MYVVLDIRLHANGFRDARSYSFELQEDVIAYCKMRDDFFKEYHQRQPSLYEPYGNIGSLEGFSAICQSYMNRFGPDKIPLDLRVLFNQVGKVCGEVGCGFEYDFGPLGGFNVPEDMIGSFICDYYMEGYERTFPTPPRPSVPYVVLDVYREDGVFHARSHFFKTQVECIEYCNMRDDIYKRYYGKKVLLDDPEHFEEMYGFDHLCSSYVDRFGADKIPLDMRQLFSKIRYEVMETLGTFTEEYNFGPMSGEEVPEDMIHDFVFDYRMKGNEAKEQQMRHFGYI